MRRTFAARAEDMAPSDTTGSLPDPGRGGPAAAGRFRGTRRAVLAAVAVVVVAATTAGVALVARDGDREAGRLTTVAEQAPSRETDGDAVTALRAVVEALQDERNLAAATLMGIDEALALPVTDTAQARSETDATIASFAAFVSGDPDRAAYRPGLDGLAALDELRRDIDADAGPRTLDNVGTAQQFFDRYAGLVAGLLDGQQAYAERLDEPVVRAGALAYGRGLRLDEQTKHLVQVSMLIAVVPYIDPAAELVRLQTQVEQGLDSLVAETAGTPFADAAVAVVGEVEATGLLDATGSAMDGTFDVYVVLDTAEALEDEGWSAFLDRVEETLAAEG